MNTRTRVGTEPTSIGGGSALVVIGTLAVAAGLPGVLAAGVFAALWYRLPAPYAVAFGHLALAVSAPGLGALPILATEAGLVGALAGPALASDRPLELVAQVVGGTLALGALAWAGTRWWGAVWPSALVLAVAVGALAYGLCEYERYVFDRPEGTA